MLNYILAPGYAMCSRMSGSFIPADTDKVLWSFPNIDQYVEIFQHLVADAPYMGLSVSFNGMWVA